jgi:putative ABC transport system permease protein
MKVLQKIRAVFRKKRLDAEMTEEVRLQLEQRVRENIPTGLAPNEVRYAALRKFGGVEQAKEIARGQRGWLWLENLIRDCRFSFRSLRRSAGFSLAVVVTLALCIGANTTIMSVLYGLILRPMPFPDAGQLVEIYTSFPKNNQPKRPVSVTQYVDFKQHADLFAGLALWNFWTYNIADESDPERGIGARVTADYFSILGVQPLLGRFYTMEECVPGKDGVVVLTQSFWERKYHADPAVLGRVVRLSGRNYTIIGVAPRSLEALNTDATFLKPFEWQPAQAAPQARFSQNGILYARLRPGVAPTAALAQLNTLEKQFQEQVAPAGAREFIARTGFQMGLGRVRAEQTKSVRTSLLLLQAGAFFVLLLGCVNVANLMLARANARQVELAVRQALGAGRAALARQMIVEGLLLAGLGTACGLALTWTSLRLINTYTTAIVREVEPVVVDGTVLGATLLTTVVVALLIAALPVARTWRTSLLTALQGGARGVSASGGMRMASGLLVTAQVALALVLLVGAGLLLRSFARVMAVDPGFDAAHVIQGRVAFESIQNVDAARSINELVLTRMREIPGVEKVAATNSFALNGRFPIQSLPIRGSATGNGDTLPSASLIIVSPEYFDVMGIRLLEGRLFTAADLLPNAPRVYAVDRDFARKYFPGHSPVGESFDFGDPALPPQQWPRIIGVVTVAKLNGIEDRSGVPFVYVPLGPSGAFSVVLRTTLPAATIVPQMRRKLREVDASLPLYNVRSLQAGLDDMLANRRGVMWLLGAFAGIALLLAAVGIYGMLAYDVAQRTKEIGIRGAIGATRGQIVGLILRQGLWNTGIGVAIGLAGAVFLSRYLGSLLFEVKPTDPAVFAGVTLLLLAVSLGASWLPAWRAARVDPMVALRAE